MVELGELGSDVQRAASADKPTLGLLGAAVEAAGAAASRRASAPESVGPSFNQNPSSFVSSNARGAGSRATAWPPRRTCRSWAPGHERVKAKVPLKPTSSSELWTRSQIRTFGGIENTRVKKSRPTVAQKEELARFTQRMRAAAERRIYLVVFVNSKSGGQIGGLLLKVLDENLGQDPASGKPCQGEVCDLSLEGEPEATIRRLADNIRSPKAQTDMETRVLVCGGDGTVTWILTALEHCPGLEGLLHRVPVGIVPLGTGNDLARALGWGKRLHAVSGLLEYLRWAMEAIPTELDQWRLLLRPHFRIPDTHKLRTRGSHPQPVGEELAAQLHADFEEAMPTTNFAPGAEVFLGLWQNYFSIGLDAKIASYVDTARGTECGQHCFRGGCGKACYAWQSALNIAGAVNLPPAIPAFKVAADAEEEFDDLVEPLASRKVQGSSGYFQQIMMVNINSYAGGLKVMPYRTTENKRPSHGDGRIEVMAIKHLLFSALAFVGVQPSYLFSTGAIAFTLAEGNYMQLDGEPWEIEGGCDILITPHRKVSMLQAGIGKKK